MTSLGGDAEPGRWVPVLAAAGRGTLHDRLVDAVRRDVSAGVLRPGERLPTHRELALLMGIGIGTVTKAYAEAVRLGLLVSRVGRGTCVASEDAPRPPPRTVDLTLNLPPSGPSSSRLGGTLARLGARADIADMVEFAPHLGFEAHRRAAAAWLARRARFPDAAWARLAICSGAQQAMFLALEAACAPGQAVMSEALTFHGFKAIAAHRGWPIAGLEMDREGLLPEAFERHASRGTSRVLYVQPTLHNPTARTMSLSRRLDIVRIARRYDVTIVEGDLYGPLAWHCEAAAEGGAAPLAMLAPERTYYVGGVSKVMASGLRTGFLVVPDAAAVEAVERAMRANCYAASALGPLVASEWIRSGVADDVLAEIASAAAARVGMALERLGGRLETPSHPATLHLWMPLDAATAGRVVDEARRAGLRLMPPTAPVADGGPASGIRLCACAPPDLGTLRRALDIVAAALDRTEASGEPTIV